MRSTLICLILMLSACASPEQVAHRRYLAEQQRLAQERAYMDGLAARCAGFGYRHGEQRHSDCMMQLHQQNLASRGAAAASLIQGVAAEQIRQDAEDARARQRIYNPLRRY